VSIYQALVGVNSSARAAAAAAALLALASSVPLAGAAPTLPQSFPGVWQSFGRVEVTVGEDSVTIANGFLADLRPMGDCELSFRARMPRPADQVQIWGAMRVRDRQNRYVFGLRGGSEPQISLARYAAEGNSKFLGFAPLNFKPVPEEWYRFRVAVSGNRFHVYVNDDALPRLNLEDAKNTLWNDGGVALGGGWLPAEFTDLKVEPLTGERLAAFKAVGDRVWEPPPVDKAMVRARQRAAYQPLKIAELPEARLEVKLDGNWLFMPDQDLDPARLPCLPDVPDQNWHVIPVPSFWTPTLAWLHGEKGMPDARGLSSYHGPSDKLIVEEYDRVNAQTFDWRTTKAGWFRHYLELPRDLKGKQFNLVFDAIAKISEIWVNGVKVGSNTGMFREIDCDLGGVIKPGRNVIAVHVIGNPETTTKGANKVEAVAVTVEVTGEMLRSLPHGMMDNNSSGIWQPVKLVVTNPVRVGDVFIQPRTDAASVDVELLNGDAQPHAIELSYAIRDDTGQSVLLDFGNPAVRVTVPAKSSAKARIETPKIQPKLWSPQEPNLYVLDVKVVEKERLTDLKSTRFGFRTFTVSGNQFLLNGKPYWLRGANHTPATLRPNDGLLARRFMQLARDGNIWVTRSHALPFTETWLEAADEVGFGVSFEGTWPWLMIRGEPPSPERTRIWHEEFLQLIRKYRNHPSVLIWTVNNEMNFATFDDKNPPLLQRKWAILDDMIRDMRRTDPTRPISAYSGYVRKQALKGFNAVVKPDKFDDGDIDDAHVYYSWYGDSVFHFFDGQFGAKFATPNRPLISQEFSTGYPRNDDWPSRSYEFARYVPQALVGNYAFEQNDPAIFMTRQAFITKELVEAIRRTDHADTAGLMPFAYLTWFTDVWKADQIRPKLTYYELKKAMRGVLASAELFGRHFYAGDSVRRRLCLINDADDERAVPAGTLTWEIRGDQQVLARGTVATPAVEYFQTHWLDVNLKMPGILPEPRMDAKLSFTLADGTRVFSSNDYDVVLATREWAQPRPGTPLQVYDPARKSKNILAGLDCTTVTSLENISGSNLLVVGDLATLMKSGIGPEELKAFAKQGGKVLLLQPGEDLVGLLPDLVKSYRPTKGEIVTLLIPESPVFDGIQPLDTAWFELGQGSIPQACSGVYQVDGQRPEITALALQCDFHGDLKPDGFSKIAGYPLVEIHLGKGIIIASEMLLSARNQDPIAGRLLANLVKYLASPQ